MLNRTGGALDLAGWSVADNHGSDLIPDQTLPPGSFAVIAASSDFYAEFPEWRGRVVFVGDGRIGNGLSNKGDRLRILDPTGAVIDALSYGDDSGVMSPPCPDVKAGHSLERRPADLDTNQAADFAENTVPTPGLGPAAPAPTPSPVPSATASPAPTRTAAGTPSPSPSPAPELTPMVPSESVPAAAPGESAQADNDQDPASGGGSGSSLDASPPPGPTASPQPDTGRDGESPSLSMWLYAVICGAVVIVGSMSVVVIRKLRPKA